MTMRSWIKAALVPAVCVGALALSACSDDHNDSDRGRRSSDTMTMERSRGGSPEQRILSRLHAENMEEIQVGQLAQSKGSTDAARRYGEHLVRDHTDADRRVTDTANRAGITLLTMDEVKRMKAQEMGVSTPPDPVRELSGLSGQQFDRMLAVRMRDGHRMLIQAVERARGEVRDTNVRSLLDEMLPTLRMHEQMAADMVR